MKRALNKGVKKHVKLLWGKRSSPDVAAAVYPASSPAHSARRQASTGSRPGLNAAGNVAPPLGGECYSPAATPWAGSRHAHPLGCWLNGA